ncbi:MAG: MBL fold metallo-hydrolase [Solirubrobacterales bacterium]
MKELAEGVWRLDEFPPARLINVYLAGDILIDAGRTWDKGRILKQTADRDVSMLALTHTHPDHQGSAHAVCGEREIPLACHADDVDRMEGRVPVRASDAPVARLYEKLWAGPPHKVDQVLDEGDEVGGFRVVHVPGHCPGQVLYWRESDRVAICGDTLRNMTFITLRPKLKEMAPNLTPDVAEARRSIRKLADLGPEITMPGHGPPVRGPEPIAELADRLGV